MPAIDHCEPQVIRAFEKAGWAVIQRPLTIRLSRERRVYADLLLEHQAQKIIIVEVKCFTSGQSTLDELYHAIGQYMVYQAGLDTLGYVQPLYLVLPLIIYESLSNLEAIRLILTRAKIKVIVVDLDREEITVWLTQLN
jgi:hypothetical protein